MARTVKSKKFKVLSLVCALMVVVGLMSTVFFASADADELVLKDALPEFTYAGGPIEFGIVGDWTTADPETFDFSAWNYLSFIVDVADYNAANYQSLRLKITSHVGGKGSFDDSILIDYQAMKDQVIASGTNMINIALPTLEEINSLKAEAGDLPHGDERDAIVRKYLKNKYGDHYVLCGNIDFENITHIEFVAEAGAASMENKPFTTLAISAIKLTKEPAELPTELVLKDTLPEFTFTGEGGMEFGIVGDWTSATPATFDFSKWDNLEFTVDVADYVAANFDKFRLKITSHVGGKGSFDDSILIDFLNLEGFKGAAVASGTNAIKLALPTLEEINALKAEAGDLPHGDERDAIVRKYLKNKYGEHIVLCGNIDFENITHIEFVAEPNGNTSTEKPPFSTLTVSDIKLTKNPVDVEDPEEPEELMLKEDFFTVGAAYMPQEIGVLWNTNADLAEKYNTIIFDIEMEDYDPTKIGDFRIKLNSGTNKDDATTQMVVSYMDLVPESGKGTITLRLPNPLPAAPIDTDKDEETVGMVIGLGEKFDASAITNFWFVCEPIEDEDGIVNALRRGGFSSLKLGNIYLANTEEVVDPTEPTEDETTTTVDGTDATTTGDTAAATTADATAETTATAGDNVQSGVEANVTFAVVIAMITMAAAAMLAFAKKKANSK